MTGVTLPLPVVYEDFPLDRRAVKGGCWALARALGRNMNFGRAALAHPFLLPNTMAKKKKQPFKDSRSFATKDSRSFAMMNIWPDEQPKKLSAALRRLGRSSALSACAGMEGVSKREVNERTAKPKVEEPEEPKEDGQCQAFRCPKQAIPADVYCIKHFHQQHRRAAEKVSNAVTPTSIAVSLPKLGEAGRREHLAWLRWARRADKAASGGLKKMRKSTKRNQAWPSLLLSQGGLPTLGKRR
jgi:hypothetical protein